MTEKTNTYHVKTRTVKRHEMHIAELFKGDEIVCSSEGVSDDDAIRRLDWKLECIFREQLSVVHKARIARWTP